MTRWPNADERAVLGACAERARNGTIPTRPSPDPAPLLLAVPFAVLLLAIPFPRLTGWLLCAVLLAGFVAFCTHQFRAHHDQAQQITNRRNR